MKLDLGILPKENENSCTVEAGEKNGVHFPHLPFSTLFLGTGLTIYVFFTLSLTIIIAALSCSNYNTLLSLQQQMSFTSPILCQTIPIYTSTPTIDFNNGSTTFTSNNQSTIAETVSSIMPTTTSLKYTSTALSTTISEEKETIISSSTSEISVSTDEISSTSNSPMPSQTITTTTQIGTSTTIQPQMPGYTVLQMLQNDELISNINISCWKTCNAPNMMHPTLHLTNNNNERQYFVEAFLLGKDKMEANSYVSYLVIASLFQAYQDQVHINPQWFDRLKACPTPINEPC